MKNIIKNKLLSFLIEEIAAEEVVLFIEELVMKDIWLFGFEDLIINSFYNFESIWNLIQSEFYSLDKSEICQFEKSLFLRSKKSLLKSRNNWKVTEKTIYNYINFKRKYLNLSSNQLSNDFFRILDDYELRQDGNSGILKMPKELIEILDS